MIVTPQSQVKVLRAIPWNNDYKHTRWFNNANEQLTYMNSHVAFSFDDDFSYIREQNVIRVPRVADDLYNCNYLMYRNNGFGTKWFFAFITDVKYVNTETTEISFEIDYLQTWLFDIVIGSCYVEREHVKSDAIGLHTVDEDLPTGEVFPMIVWERYWDSDAGGFKVIVNYQPSLLGDFCGDDAIKYDSDANQYHPPMADYDMNEASSINGELKNSTFTGYKITNAYMFPKEFEHQQGDATSIDFTNTGIARPTRYFNPDIVTDYYDPKNNKLFVFPYTRLNVMSTDGHSQDYRWEDFKDGTPVFDLLSNGVNVPSCELRPNYLGHIRDRYHTVPFNNFPKVQLGQFEELKAGNLMSRVASAIINPIGYIQKETESLTSHFSGTSTEGGNLDLSYETAGYVFAVYGIRSEYARIIDNYLTRFGYKVNCIKVPELTSRKYWNFVKTKECEIGGNAPTDALKRIQEMFNAGITLWHVNNVGSFTDDNPIV